jgi:ubiquinone/menaquinone biosynthesis C-methylase UbiE
MVFTSVAEHAEKVKQLYREWAPLYDKAKSESISFLVGEPVFLRTVRPKKTDRVLDAGCGTGKSLSHLLKYTRHVEGTDLSREMLAVAREKFPRVRFFVANLEESLPVKEDTYDLITCTLTFQFLADVKRPLREFYRVLKPSGKAFVMGFVSDGSLAWDDVKYKKPRRRRTSSLSRFRKLAYYRNLIAKTGFAPPKIIPLRVGPACKPLLTAESYRKIKGRWASVLFCLQKPSNSK